MISCRSYNRHADYADDLALLANTPAQAESSLHILKQAAGGTDLHMEANKIEYICFKQEAISALSGKFLEYINQLTYLGNNILSTETVNIHLLKAWTANDGLSIKWK